MTPSVDQELTVHKDLMDDKDETDSCTSTDSAELIRKNKRKRIDAEESPAKRRSEEPLVKLNVTSEEDNKNKNLDKDFEKEKGEDTENDGIKKNKKENDNDDIESEKVDKEEKEQTPNKDDEEDDEDGEEDEIYEVEKIIDYAYCKESEEGLYLVKWIGWDSDNNTWEPVDNLDCRDILVNFYNQRIEQRKDSTPSEKRLLQLPPDPRDSSDMRELFLKNYYTKPTQAELEKLYQLKLKNKAPKVISESALKKDMEALANSKKVKEKKLESIRTQLNLRELKKFRDKQTKQLKDWEEKINKIEKDDSHVAVINNVDLESPPTLMEYINCYKAGEGITIPDDPPLGCDCLNCGVNSKGCCSRVAGFDLAYTHHGKLRVDIGYPIYECNKRCKCPATCRNRVVQKGRSVKLAIYRTDNGCGWGVKALEKIKEGSFVVQYVGEVITSEEAESRGKKYDADGRTYLFDLDFNLGDENIYTVDAAFFGNLSHFINHSCDPNLSIFNVYINCLDPNLPQLCLFARRDIEKGEQLTFDYCQSTQSVDDDTPKSPSKTPLKTGVGSPTARVGTPGSAKGKFAHKSQKTTCRCGSKNCRKVLF